MVGWFITILTVLISYSRRSYACSRGKSYQRFKLLSHEEKEAHKERCRKNVKTRIRNRAAAAANSVAAGNARPVKVEDPERESGNTETSTQLSDLEKGNLTNNTGES